MPVGFSSPCIIGLLGFRSISMFPSARCASSALTGTVAALSALSVSARVDTVTGASVATPPPPPLVDGSRAVLGAVADGTRLPRPPPRLPDMAANIRRRKAMSPSVPCGPATIMAEGKKKSDQMMAHRITWPHAARAFSARGDRSETRHRSGGTGSDLLERGRLSQSPTDGVLSLVGGRDAP